MAQTGLTVASDIIIWTMKDEEALPQWRHTLWKCSQIICGDLSKGWGPWYWGLWSWYQSLHRSTDPVSPWHCQLLWCFELKPLQLLLKWCSWECLLIPDSELEFQFFFQPLIARLPSLFHTFTFCLLFPNVQDCSAVVQQEGSKIFYFEYAKGAAA